MSWKRFLKLENIYIRNLPLQILQTFITPFIICIFLLMAASMSTIVGGIPGSLGDYFMTGVVVLAILAGVGLVWLLRQLLLYFQVRRILGSRRYIGEAGHLSASQIAAGAASEELDQLSATPLIKQGKTWKIYDAIFTIMRRNRHGSHKAQEAYYTVFEAKLTRAVPHLLFDAKGAKGKQFGRLYLAAQRLQLGADFGNYFEAYSPKYYAIDTLSFITPEVMEAMIAMAEYDIELLNGHLLCYAPLLEGPALADFERAGLNLLRHLNDNLRSYKDDRLAREARQSQVTNFGKQLLRNPYRQLPAAVGIGLILVALIIIGTSFDRSIIYSQMAFVCIFVFIGLVVNIVRIKYQNRRKEALFLAGQERMADSRPHPR